MHSHFPTHSSGIIPLSKESGEWRVFLIAHYGYEKYWGCPKGHVEQNETDRQAAERELTEETNLEIVRFLHEDPIYEEFEYIKEGKSVLKRILFFAAEVRGSVILQKQEIVAGKWFLLPEAIEKTIHSQGKTTLMRVLEILA
jgi:8-oxo-dGTP pyrophosphatase MutT (NUDIX family)